MSRRKKRRKFKNPIPQQVGEIRPYRDVWRTTKQKKICGFCFYPVNQYEFLIFRGSLFKINVDKKMKLLDKNTVFCSFECLLKHLNEIKVSPLNSIPEDFKQPILEEYEKN